MVTCSSVRPSAVRLLGVNSPRPFRQWSGELLNPACLVVWPMVNWGQPGVLKARWSESVAMDDLSSEETDRPLFPGPAAPDHPR